MRKIRRRSKRSSDRAGPVHLKDEFCGTDFSCTDSIFAGQSFAVAMEIGDMVIIAQTNFGGTFLFTRQRLALEAWINPV
ncbi:hypothetical protein LR032_01190 [Candidatus Bipolaricaulota bacterium]|nr:hypothetical protein [Candidatus Bipolaricaulota bacterium]